MASYSNLRFKELMELVKRRSIPRSRSDTTKAKLIELLQRADAASGRGRRRPSATVRVYNSNHEFMFSGPVPSEAELNAYSSVSIRSLRAILDGMGYATKAQGADGRNYSKRRMMKILHLVGSSAKDIKQKMSDTRDGAFRSAKYVYCNLRKCN